jgi:hypothetical protein
MKTIYANVLLSDGKILFWYIGDECKNPTEFYKDFYYANINMAEYEKYHKLEIKKMGFTIYDMDDNNFVFNVLAKLYFQRFEISADSKGRKPY